MQTKNLKLLISYLLGYYLRQKELNILLVALITSSTFMNITWKQKGERIIVVDSNFMIFFDKMKAISKQKVFIISKISKLSVNKDYNHNLWMRIKSFWKKGAVGCISFSYEGKIVYFGDNLTIEEAKKLICLLNERQFLVEQNFQ